MTRAGYAGEDTPRVMFPTSFGYVDTEEELAGPEQPTAPTTQADGDIVMGEEQQSKGTTKKRNYYIGDNKINKFKSNLEIKSPLKDGLGTQLLIIFY